MRCLLCPTPDEQRPRGGESDFESLFGDFVREKKDLWWSVSGGSYSPWNLPPEWYGDDDAEDTFYGQFEEISDSDGGHAVAPAADFRDAMKYLTDDWLEVYAFRERPLTLDVDSWAGDGLPLPVSVARGATHAFVNVDGSYWAALSVDEALLRRFSSKWPLARFVAVAKTGAR
jgi:hypothetical protein